MRWQMGRRSDNIEDQRGMPVGRGTVVGGGIGTLVLVLLALYFGVDPSVILQGVDPGSPGPTRSVQQQRAPAGDDQLRDFVSVILADTEDTWGELFRRMGRRYEQPRLVLFSGAIESACGFAQAYVIAHEIGHHVQNLLGIAERVQAAQGRRSRTEANALQVRMELQADCLAGVWANNAQRARNILESGDIEEGLNAAAAIGDDRLQRQSQGRVVPESFTHGSSEQRVRWFKRGIESGEPGQCDTFAASKL